MPTVTTTRSGLINEISYDEATNELTLDLHGKKYKYFKVPQQVFTDLLAADSAGKYFLANIKNQYRYEKMD